MISQCPSVSACLLFAMLRKHIVVRALHRSCGRGMASRAADGPTDATTGPDQPQRTALYNFHIARRGKIVNFGGYLLPVQYGDQSIIASHLHTRRHASIFDVSHMLQTHVRGRNAVACMESICTADMVGAADGTSLLTVFTDERGCIRDDLIVTKVSAEHLYVVSNAAMKQQDMAVMDAAVSQYKAQRKDVAIEFLSSSDQSLIAVQGPDAVTALGRLVPSSIDLRALYFMNTLVTEIAGVPGCRVTRCGYTGEDGVEISIPSDRVQHVTEALLDTCDQVKLAGLGARDSLRLEAGLCLYGSDIDAQTTPIEAALSWLVAKRRRATADFPGALEVCRQLKEGVSRRRIGLCMTGVNVPAARAGVPIYYEDKHVGTITSGCPSPSLSKNIAMGYILDDLKAPGTPVRLKIRDNFYPAEVSRTPFVSTNYYVKPK